MNRDLKLRKIGNSLGLVLPKEALAHLRVREGDTVTVSEAADGSLRLSPTSTEVTMQMAAAQEVMKRYRNTLRELAK
jgi:putative addiction module antidote